jgi:ubiquinone/menaquinone biosynthesis C-methylase UbiE
MSRLKALVRCSVKPIHQYFRSSKARRFLELLNSVGAGRLLDVGGETDFFNEAFFPIYERFDSATIVNLDHVDHRATDSLGIRVVNGDGRSLPFADKSFDWVFSNAVIEHVGSWPDQQRFSAEIRRVAARGYFVTTPNLFFPIEPHTLLPLYQFYPARFKHVALWCSPYMREVENIRLLTKKELQFLFPEAQVKRVNFASSLMVFHVF